MVPRGLKYVCDRDEGIFRKKRGKGFVYVDAKGRKIENKKTLERIEALVVPPMWNDVWICQDEKGHLQVTGLDLKGRKQYLYHKKYIAYRQKDKYKQLYEFGINLPIIRSRIQKDLKLEGWPKEKLLALAVKSLDEYHFRIGSERYLEENETFGLTTLRRKHLSENGNGLVIEYKGKSGKYRTINISNPKLISLIKETSELPGHEVFRYLDDSKKSRKIDSQDVNEYIRAISDREFTAKDFRTWGGTVSTIEVARAAKKEIEENPRKKLETLIVKKVSERLGNTIATCREYYIHPKVLKEVMKKDVAEIPTEIPDIIKYPHLLKQAEKKVLNIIEK